MGKRGPAPKPTKLKILNGNPGKRPLNEHQPQPSAGEPQCPDWMPAEAKRKWRELVPELLRIGMLTVVDRETLAAYCLACSELKQATERLQKDGRYQTTKNGYLTDHPAVAQQRSAMEVIKRFSVLFGLDPSSRQGIDLGGSGSQGAPESVTSFARKRG